jgi:hypothetical protein
VLGNEEDSLGGGFAAVARHQNYSRVFMVGNGDRKGDLHLWRPAEGGGAVNDMPFEFVRLMDS